MKLRDLFLSNAAAATLAFGLMQGGAAWADGPDADGAPAPAMATPDTAVVIPTTTARSVTLNPLIPVGAVAGLGALYTVFCLMAAQKRMKGSWLRMAGGGVLAVTLLNPEFRQEERQPLSTEIVVLVDRSASQNLGDRTVMTDEAQQRLLGDLGAVAGVNVRLVEVDPRGMSDGTELFGALQATLSDIGRDRLGAVFVLSDGQVHDVPARTATILGEGVPLHALVSGREDEPDRRIVIDQAPRFGMVGAEQEILFTVFDDGKVPGGRIRVTPTVDGTALPPQFVDAGVPAKIRLKLDHAGTNVVELSAEALDGELTTVNNRVVTSIEGVRQNLNVLLISGSPDAGARMWRDLLKSDPDVNLVHFNIMRDITRNVDPTPLRDLALIGFPADEVFGEKLEKFDLIIFDRYGGNSFGINQSHMEKIAARVKAGGALLMVGGPEYADPFAGLQDTPIGEILPTTPTENVIEEAFRPRVTPVGARHPVTRDLAPPEGAPPWGRWVRMVEAEVSPTAKVVMDGAGERPLLVMDRVEKGRVVTLLSDNSWLWRRGFDGGGPHAAMLRQAFRWLVKEPAMEEEALRLHAERGVLIIEQQTMAEKNAPVIITAPSGGTITVTPEQVAPGLFRASVPADEFGTYRAHQDKSEAAANVQAVTGVGPSNPREFAEVHSTLAALQPATDETKGHISRMGTDGGGVTTPRIVPVTAPAPGAAMGSADWAGIRMTDAHILKDVERTPLIPPWLGFAAIVGMIAAAWAREGEWNPFARNKKQAGPGAPGPSL